MQIESLADWDRHPVREILAGLLIKEEACVLAAPWLEQELEAMTKAGLVEYRLATDVDAATLPCDVVAGVVWVVRSTMAGRIVALGVAESGVLLTALMAFARLCLVGGEWPGASPDDIVVELDLREGGRGEVDNPGQWLAARTTEQIVALPRRHGLDPLPEGDRHAS